MRVAVQSQKVNLLSVDVADAATKVYKLNIDSQLQEFTVSVSGQRPRVVLKDPQGMFVVSY